MGERASILVTGGAGFIGSCFVRQWLAEESAAVVNLDKLTYAASLQSLSSVLDHPRHHFVQADINDVSTVADLFGVHRPEAVIHFAAETHVDRSIDSPANFVQTNVVGTMRLLEAALRYWRDGSSDVRRRFRFLNVSTDEVFGTIGAETGVDESAPYAPSSPYAASKASADHLVRAYGRTYGLPVLTTNCSNNYGPYQFPEKLVPLMIRRARQGRSLPVYGDGGQVRDWLYVEDHCAALRQVLSQAAPGEVFNIGTGHGLANLELVNMLCRILDELATDLPCKPTADLIEFVTDRPGHDRRYALDCGKITRQLGWQPRVNLEAGLRQTVAWCLENEAWLDQLEATSNYRQDRLGQPH